GTTCHDCSEGGLATAVAEMAFAGGHGADVHLGLATGAGEISRDDALAFGEAPGRFVMAVSPKDAAAVEAVFAGLPFAWIGEVRADDRVLMTGKGGQGVVATRIHAVERAFRGHLA
ncbi:MAG: hypothetical protein KC502_17355, partial [Myxococcales bacterium]|nr:hypothetical protein [Myxococcales bacterium]